MKEVHVQWGESEWQNHVQTVLLIQHELNRSRYIPIPDKVGGDGGLEGFSTDGCGYQCYADQDSVSTADRAQKQKEKITSDLPKLKKYQRFWKKVLQDVKLKYWILVVPIVEDKSVVAHARKKAKELRAESLPFLATDFQAAVLTDKDFPDGYQRATAPGRTRLNLPAFTVQQKDIENYVAAHPALVKTLEGKLKQVFGKRHSNLTETRRELLDWFLKGTNLLDHLRKDAPGLWTPIRECTDLMGQSIRTSSRFDRTRPNERLMATWEKLKHELSVVTGHSLGQSDLTIVTWATVVDWLLECSLHFPEATKP